MSRRLPIANTVPLDPSMPMIPVDVEGHPKSVDFPAPMMWAGAVSPDYLRLMSIPLLAGREFNGGDSANSPAVLLITPATARRFWPGENPIGKHIKPAFETQWQNGGWCGGRCPPVQLGREPAGVDGRRHVHALRSIRSRR